jgi:hypothetical protein
MTDDQVPEVVEQAEYAYEAVRRINHLTGGPMPAPLVYQVLGNLKMVGHSLPQALRQLGEGLLASLDTYDVYEDDDRDPVISVATAWDHLTQAAELAAQLGRHLEQAQSAISRQGYRTAGDQR